VNFRLVSCSEGKVREDWEKIKVDVMYKCNKAKMEQNPDFEKVLCSTMEKEKKLLLKNHLEDVTFVVEKVDQIN
jgi:predicted NAD-dependent protein-ADP-ribosyltransferase YbiA (DUF1768 family)